MHIDRTPKVTIITVVYNGVLHLEQTILSVLNQNYSNIEYIIIDGGSTDGTVELIKRYEERIDYWVSEPDAGIYDGMNKGIRKANGEYIGLINADDWYELDAVSTVVASFTASKVDVVYGSMLMIEKEQKLFIKKAVNNLQKLDKGMLINHPTVFAKRALYDTYGLFDTSYKIAADWEMMLRWWIKDVRFMAVDKVFSNFRMGGISSVHLKKSFEEKHQIRQKHKRYILLDHYYVIDKLKKLIPSSVLSNISLARQYKREN